MWDGNRSEPLCTTRTSFQKTRHEHYDQFIRRNLNKIYLEPCLSIEKIQIEYDEVDYDERDSDEDDEGWLILEFLIQANKFKEIKQVRKYTVQSLVGNSGGYIGLFMGYALWNVPCILVDIRKYIKSMYSRHQLSIE